MSFQFKLNTDSVQNLEKSVKEAFNKVISSNNMLNEIGETVVNDVVDQTRNQERSIPLKSDLKLLKESWLAQKKWLSNSTNTDAAYELGRSNLTFSGQLLNSFTWIINGVGKIKLYFKGTHDPYTAPTGVKYGKPIENEKLAEYVAKQGRPFVGVRPAIRSRINRTVRTYVRRALIVSKLLK